MATNPQHIAKRQNAALNGHIEGSRWFRLWIVSGLILAAMLLASSISTYILVSRGLPPTERLIVGALPFLTPAGTILSAEMPVRPRSAQRLPHSLGAFEMAEFWNRAGAALWPLKRHLMINASAALMLFMLLSVIALRFRSCLARLRLEQEFEAARSVQLGLLPNSDCELDNFEVAADHVPSGHIGGDFFDTFALSGERAAFVLGDVCGKGMPAALLMGVLHGAVRSSGWAESPGDHQESTRRMNQFLCDRTASARFASMFWSYFDSRSQHLKYINAGHCAPLLVKARYRNTILHLCSGGPALGLMAGIEFQQGSVRLERGDVLVLYSDGIVGAANTAGEEFGEDRLTAIVRARSQHSAEQIRNHILGAVDAFTGPLMARDDRTLMVIVYLGVERPAGGGKPLVNLQPVGCA